MKRRNLRDVAVTRQRTLISYPRGNYFICPDALFLIRDTPLAISIIQLSENFRQRQSLYPAEADLNCILRGRKGSERLNCDEETCDPRLRVSSTRRGVSAESPASINHRKIDYVSICRSYQTKWPKINIELLKIRGSTRLSLCPLMVVFTILALSFIFSFFTREFRLFFVFAKNESL